MRKIITITIAIVVSILVVFGLTLYQSKPEPSVTQQDLREMN